MAARLERTAHVNIVRQVCDIAAGPLTSRPWRAPRIAGLASGWTSVADTIQLDDDDIPALVSAGDGDDVVAVVANGPAVVHGGNGNETILAGRDTLVLPSRGTDTVESSEF